MPQPGNLVGVVRKTIAACVWATCAGFTVTALLFAHMVGRDEQLEARILALLGRPGRA